MNNLEKSDWKEHFERVTSKIANLAGELTDKTEFEDFIDRMDAHIRELETILNLFKDAVDREKNKV